MLLIGLKYDKIEELDQNNRIIFRVYRRVLEMK